MPNSHPITLLSLKPPNYCSSGMNSSTHTPISRSYLPTYLSTHSACLCVPIHNVILKILYHPMSQPTIPVIRSCSTKTTLFLSFFLLIQQVKSSHVPPQQRYRYPSINQQPNKRKKRHPMHARLSAQCKSTPNLPPLPRI